MLLAVACLLAESGLRQNLPHMSLLTGLPDLSAPRKIAEPLELVAEGSASPAQLLLALLATTAGKIRSFYSRKSSFNSLKGWPLLRTCILTPPNAHASPGQASPDNSCSM